MSWWQIVLGIWGGGSVLILVTVLLVDGVNHFGFYRGIPWLDVLKKAAIWPWNLVKILWEATFPGGSDP